ncbi:MAG: HlyD family secretion protein [Gammaproteobacteria bacterium]|jgi:HlyD family secretion protein|nr:HlyD family secretion protein [Gammaproteobacteria bacterium]
MPPHLVSHLARSLLYALEQKKRVTATTMKWAAELANYRRLQWTLSAALLLIATAPGSAWLISRAGATTTPGLATYPPHSGIIAAVGRVEPRDGVLSIAAPASDLGPSIVTTLQVHEGEWVEAGRTLATLRGYDELQAALTARQRRIAVAQARLSAIESGGKTDDIKAMRAEVQSEEAVLAQALSDAQRAKQLHAARLVATAALESEQSHLEIATRSLEAKRARLSSLSSVRPADVAVAEAELHAAEADADEARAKLDEKVVRAPCEGKVLAIYAYPGQSVGAQGLLAFGKAREMFVDAEVMEEDVDAVSVGQAALITGDTLRGPATGTVEEIGYLVGSREVFKADPAAFTDSRIVHVKIRVSDPSTLQRFINARVSVEIQR